MTVKFRWKAKKAKGQHLLLYYRQGIKHAAFVASCPCSTARAHILAVWRILNRALFPREKPCIDPETGIRIFSYYWFGSTLLHFGIAPVKDNFQLHLLTACCMFTQSASMGGNCIHFKYCRCRAQVVIRIFGDCPCWNCKKSWYLTLLYLPVETGRKTWKNGLPYYPNAVKYNCNSGYSAIAACLQKNPCKWSGNNQCMHYDKKNAVADL
jgi:hypothetical protein